MFEIGDSLREARTRRGLSAADVQKGIRVRERYLSALEEERWELLPGEAYTKGFLRTYAEFLGLDGNLYIEEYNARVASHDEEPALVPGSLSISHRSRRGVIRTLMGVLVLSALVAGLAAWGMGGTPTVSHAPTRVHDVSAAVATPAPVVKTKPVVQAKPVATTTVITASRGRCWLLIRTGGPSGALVFQGILEQGKALRYTLTQKLWVRLGQPRSVDIRLGGRLVNGLPAQPSNVLLTSSGPEPA